MLVSCLCAARLRGYCAASGCVGVPELYRGGECVSRTGGHAPPRAVRPVVPDRFDRAGPRHGGGSARPRGRAGRRAGGRDRPKPDRGAPTAPGGARRWARGRAGARRPRPGSRTVRPGPGEPPVSSDPTGRARSGSLAESRAGRGTGRRGRDPADRGGAPPTPGAGGPRVPARLDGPIAARARGDPPPVARPGRPSPHGGRTPAGRGAARGLGAATSARRRIGQPRRAACSSTAPRNVRPSPNPDGPPLRLQSGAWSRKK